MDIYTKSLYGLKQALRAWTEKIYRHFLLHGLKKYKSDPNHYVKKVKEETLVVAVYVDDLLITGPNFGLINDLKYDLKKTFHMSDLGELNYFLCLQVYKLHDGLLI